MNLGKLVQNAGSDLKKLTDDELTQLHLVLLGMIDDLKDVCEYRGLRYYFIGGSAIGALRHEGFIPWDNDIDLAMPRKDFEAFCDIIQKEYNDKYSIINPTSEHNSGRVLPKLRKKDTVYQTILETDLDECGVFIDMYILENTYDFVLFRQMHGLLCMAAGFTLACRRAYDKTELFQEACKGSMKQSAIFRLKKFCGAILSPFSIERVARFTDACYGICKNENSKYITIPADDLGYFFGNVYKRSEFCTPAYAQFESRKVVIPGNYKSYLKDKYGDYMQMPDLKSRKNPLYLNFKI